MYVSGFSLSQYLKPVGSVINNRSAVLMKCLFYVCQIMIGTLVEASDYS